MVGHVIERGLPRHSILNINLPDLPLADITGVRPARLGGASAHDYVFLADDDGGPAGKHYLPCEHPATGDWVDTDFDVVASGAVAVTPLRYDLLDPDLLADLASWDLDLERLRG
jgi:5'-nucleotidase